MTTVYGYIQLILRRKRNTVTAGSAQSSESVWFPSLIMLRLLMFSFPGLHRNTDDSILGIQITLIVFTCGTPGAFVQAHWPV